MKSPPPFSPNQSIKMIIELGKNLLESSTIDEQRDCIIRYAEAIFTAEVILWLPDQVLQYSGRDKLEERNAYHSQLTSLMSLALERKSIFSGNDPEIYDTEIYDLEIYDLEINESAINDIDSSQATLAPGNYAAAPVLYKDIVFGVIQVRKNPEAVFSPEDIDLLESFNNQAAISLFANRRGSKDKHQEKLLSLVQTVSAQIANILDLDNLSEQVTRLIQETFGYYYVAIFTLDKSHQNLVFRASAYPIQQEEQVNQNNPRSTVSVEMGQGIIGSVAQSGTKIVANDVELDPDYRRIDLLAETMSEAALPLIVDAKVLGVLDVQSDQKNAFTDSDILVLQALADNIAKAVESARLYSDINYRANQLAVVSTISNALTSILDYDSLIKEVVKLVYQNLGYPVVRLYSVHTGRRRIFYQAGFSAEGDHKVHGEFSLDLDDDSLEISRAARDGVTRLMQNNDKDHTWAISTSSQKEYKQILIVPLIFMDEVLGILELQSDQADSFHREELIFIEALADHIAIAYRNASLYRSELWRRQVADSMRELAGMLTANKAVDQVLNLILLELEKDLPCDAAAIWLVGENTMDESSIQLHLADVILTEDYIQKSGDREGTLSTQDVSQILTQSDLPSSWLIDALGANNPQIRNPKDPYEPLGALLDFPPDYSAIAAPLRVKDEPFGVLVLTHHTSSRYGHESQSMTETFANYAAVAIENTRLYETAHDQAWVSTVLLQVSEATQSVNSLDELLTTLVRITPLLIGVNSCSVYLWDNSTDTFTPTATYGRSQPEGDQFSLERIHLGELPCFDQLLLSKEPVFVDYQSSNDYFNSFDLESNTLVLFPMISHNEVLGAFLIDYRLGVNSNDEEGVSPNIGWDEKFSIIQGITHQAAVAVENIRLIKAQQDEAYVSVALLQVAQAIVSLNALDEILEAIVRITPILVGVKRSLIFIWDEAQNSFRLMKYYGVNRSDLAVLGSDFSPEEFPLLNSVQKSNSIVFHEVDEDSDSPLEWVNLENHEFDFIESEIIPDLEDNLRRSSTDDYIGKDYRKASSGLLYGFPIAVKGVVLGVLLTQEREGPGELPSRQIREKRLEISIGISQQAAMAIQNDLLQREALERERLEQEIQLARNIQQSFLPDTLPHHDKWELFSLWRPARQVSGDFYDVIPLGSDKWGLVIADVADKGMPAALYMTLIRTLLRASAKDDEGSPAAVLQRVNDLLVLESKSGMFVTLFYGVLSTRSNQMIYANAGHNPPLIVRQSHQRLQKLTGTGMALGIFESIDIYQREVRLKPGDSLVLYTDGITEAFSPNETMFGEQRLMQIVRTNWQKNARQLAQAIDLSVSSFIEDGITSDDITMLVVKRVR